MTGRAGVWTIPAHLPFLDTLVAGIFARYGRDPLALAEIDILLPTRRATRALRDAFLRASGGQPLLLPRLSALGDIDAEEIDLAMPVELGESLDLPSAMTPLRRQLLLAQLIRGWGEARDGNEILPGQALALAAELARLLDQAQTEQVSFELLATLVPADLAQHWALTVDFLSIVTRAWPAILDDHRQIDPADRRNRLIAAQADAWRARPPATPVIAAGFGSAIPAASGLLGLIASLPQGAVVLPGADTGADLELWGAVRDDPTHPQHGIARLCDDLAVAHDDLPEWQMPGTAPGRASRTVLARELMRPASVSHRWRSLDRLPEDALDGLHRFDLATPQEEAGAVALMLRHQLETPGATAMLVTSDRSLARRVAAELRRWTIDIDDSAGVPLNHTAPGMFLRLLGEAALEQLAPVPLLALLKHPLAAAGMSPGEFREQVRALEYHCLHGPRPGPGIAGLRATVSEPALRSLVDRLEHLIGGFLALVAAPATTLVEALAAHIAAAEALAATGDEPGAARLWALEAGESLAGFIGEFAPAAEGFQPIAGADYPVLFEAAISGRVVRPRWGKHPRLQILGMLEARLQQADLVILGGLNEGSWPAAPASDPWMSRPMRRKFGLASPEAQIGLAAHDFLTGFCAPRVVLTRSLRAEGAPTVPSRWLLRLDTVLGAVKLPGLPQGAHDYRAYQALLDRPTGEVRPIAPPTPRPPIAVRPRRLSVTEIETWMRDPYAIYAKHILELRALDPLDADPGVADRGMFIHQSLDRFIKLFPDAMPADAVAQLEMLGRNAFGEALARPGVWAFWWPRFLRIASWFVELETARRPQLAQSRTELSGRLILPGIERPFELVAKADRIDTLGTGELALIDYKTGTVPNRNDVALGFSPQLPLEAVIAETGGFEGIAAAEVAELGFWRLSGGDPPGEEVPLKELEALKADAYEGLLRLIGAFDDPATPYRARPRPEYAPRYSDYGHLARLQEWGTEGTE